MNSSVTVTAPAGADSLARRTIELPTGRLVVDVKRSDLPLDDICGFASRRNPKRGFLFVSKVLGKHIPARPSAVRDIHRRLAAKIPNLPGPVVVIGMAETAIALGHGVYEEYLRVTGRNDVLFIHSTRYRLHRPVALEFLEEHSHAADHIIYLPENQEMACMFRSARSLVLVDDEASTGKTFVNLVKAFQAALPGIQQVVTAVITDWRGPARTQETLSAMPVPAVSIAILEGQYGFTPAANLQAVDMPKVVGNGAAKDRLIAGNCGRLGVTGLLRGDAFVPAGFGCPSVTSSRNCGETRHCSRIPPARRHLVLGTGEFAYPPFLLAEELERRGLDVRYQSTTRSPIIEGGAISCSLTFGDNYGDGIPNFLYNARREDYDRIILCHETPAATIDGALTTTLRAEAIRL